MKAELYRRIDDGHIRLLAKLDERSINMEKLQEKIEKNQERIIEIHENRIINLEGHLNTKPCAVNEIRIAELERILRIRWYLFILLVINLIATLIK